MSTASYKKYAILILAAGASKRLGQPKQLLSYKGTTLLNHTINECCESNIGRVHLVLGNNYQSIIKTVDQTKCSILHFKGWEAGMGSSIAFGIETIKDFGYHGVILCLGDQPFLHTQILKALITKVESTNAKIVTAKYDKGQGPPVYFAQELFDKLGKLTGGDGAKKVVQAYSSNIEYIPFTKGSIDIDTQADLRWIE